MWSSLGRPSAIAASLSLLDQQSKRVRGNVSIQAVGDKLACLLSSLHCRASLLPGRSVVGVLRSCRYGVAGSHRFTVGLCESPLPCGKPCGPAGLTHLVGTSPSSQRGRAACFA